MITFKSLHENHASGRYRGSIPRHALEGFNPKGNWLVIGKHDWDWEQETKGYEKVVFDVCDDHFGTSRDAHYKNAILRADVVTCNSLEMARVIMMNTGREAFVIPDPYEQREEPPRISDKLLWYGYKRNLPDLMPYLHKLSVEVVTDMDGFTKWSPKEIDRAFSQAGLVILPTGRSMAKSANRAIESIRRGLFVVAGYLPAYSDLGIYVGNIYDGVDWALSHKMEALKRIKDSQDYIREEYSPKRIATLWMKAIDGYSELR